MQLRKIPLDSINLKDKRFLISHFFSVDQLAQSIREIGLIYPPVVTQRHGFFIPVTGWKRILACKRLSLSSLPVFVNRETDDLKSFRLALFENMTHREFDLIDRAEIVSRLKEFGETRKKIIQEYLPLLKIPPIFDYYDLYTKISCMNRKEKNLVSENKMALSVVEQLIQFSPKERKVFFPFLVLISQNKQKELLELTKEISLKKEMKVEEIFDFAEIKDVLLSENLSPIQKADRIRLLLKIKRFPLLSARERAFESAKKNLGWPKYIDLSPTPYYEDNAAHIKFSFTGNKDYVKKLSFLRRMAEKNEFASLLKTFTDE